MADKQVYRVWYRREPMFMEDPALTRHNLDQSHVAVAEIEASGPEQAYRLMQAENWSPNGEARPVIAALGLHHTSMSVGDVLEELPAGKLFEIAMCGMRPVPQ